jgi:phasin family protein
MATAKKTANTKAAEIEASVALGKEAVETVVKAGTDVASKTYEKAIAMTKENFAKAAKAGSEVYKGYEEAVAFNKENVEAFVKSGTILAKGAQDLSKVLFGIAQASLEESVAATKALFGAKSLKDVVELQASLAKVNYETALAEGKKLTDLSVKLTEEAIAPLAARVNVAVEKFSKPLAA